MDDLQGSVSVDFESEVEDDIIPLFRRGEVTEADLILAYILSSLALQSQTVIKYNFGWLLQQDFNYGVEFMLLISFLETASREAVEDALGCIRKLISQCNSFIVQATFGTVT